jgi:hypothetical protein
MIPVIIPDPTTSDKEYARYHHLDISSTESSDLLDELYCLRPLLWGLPKTDWLRQRVKRIEGELATRRVGRK